MLEINHLCANVKDKEKNILKDFCLTINKSEVHAIMGPNGAGKSTLAKVLMGHYGYDMTDGEILFNGKRIDNLSVSDRAKLGIFLCMQDPTAIEGVSNSEFLRTAMSEVTGEKVDLYDFIKELNNTMDSVKLDKQMIHRSLNLGFSGGEKKKNEILQMKMLKPKFIVLDELDSGLDVDSLRIVCDNINQYLEQYPETSVLIITHYPRILEYIHPDYVHIMENGSIKKTGDLSLAFQIDKNGYSVLDETELKKENE